MSNPQLNRLIQDAIEHLTKSDKYPDSIKHLLIGHLLCEMVNNETVQDIVTCIHNERRYYVLTLMDTHHTLFSKADEIYAEEHFTFMSFEKFNELHLH